MEESQIQYSEGEKHFTLKSYYIFKFKIEQVWSIISHPAKALIALGEWVDMIEYTEQNIKQELKFNIPMKFKKNSKLTFRWKSIFDCRLDVKEIVDNDFNKKIFFDSYAFNPFYIKYQIIYNLFWNSIEEHTLLIHEVVCKVNNKLFQNDQEENRKERYIMFKKIEEMLSNDISALWQEESTTLDISINELWTIVTDWRKFREYVPQICHEIYYSGDPQIIGTEMKIITKGKNSNGFTNLRVIESNYNEENKLNNSNESYANINNFNCENKHLDNISNEGGENVYSFNNAVSGFEYLSINNKEDFSEKSPGNSKKQNGDEYNLKNENKFKDIPNKNFNESKESLPRVSNEDILNNESSDGPKSSVCEYEYILECYEGFPKCPLQLLIFTFIKLSDNQSQLVFRHEFKQPVKQYLIRNIGIEKKKILLDFKNSLKDKKLK